MNESKNIANPLVLELAFYSTFKISVSYDVIIVLLKQRNVNVIEMIDNYKNGRKYLEVESGKFVFKKAYQTTKRRNLEVYLNPFKNVVGYLVASLISTSLIVFSFNYFKYDELFKIELLTFNIVWVIFILFIALTILIVGLRMLTSKDNIKYAVRFINSQETKKEQSKWYY